LYILTDDSAKTFKPHQLDDDKYIVKPDVFNKIIQSPDVTQSDILKTLLLYVKHGLIEGVNEYTKSDKFQQLHQIQQLQQLLNEDKDKIIQNIDNWLKEENILNLCIYNLICLQCVILFTIYTEILYKPVEFEKSFETKYNYAEYEMLSEDYCDIKFLEENIPRNLKCILEVKKIEESKRFFIFVFLDILSIRDICETYSKDIYLIGMTTQSISVDAKLYNPYSFSIHDIGHVSNRYHRVENLGTCLINEQKFIKCIDNDQKLTTEQKK
jgi:hypothetical protein